MSSGACCTAEGGRFRLWSRRSRVAASGSRRAATGVRNDRGACSQTVEDHDRRFCHRWPLTWGFSRVLPILNTMQFLEDDARADLARRKPGVQIPSPPPPNLAGQSVASVELAALTAFWGRAGAANAHG